MEQKSEATLISYFAKTALEQIAPRPTTGTIHVWQDVDVVSVQEEEKCSRIFNKLIVEGFLSVPVVDAHKQYLSTVDMLDIGALVLKCVSESGAGGVSFDESLFLEARATSLIQEHKKLHADSELVVDKGALNVWDALCKFSATPRLHRIASLANKRVSGYLTQSMLISLLAQHTTDPDLKLALDTKINALPQLQGKEPLITVSEDHSILDALKTLISKNVSGIGVVDKSGVLVDQISIRDLRGLGSNCAKFKRLTMPLKEYRALLKIEFPEQTPREILHVTGDNTLLDVLANLDDGNIHRVWVCDKPPAGAEITGKGAQQLQARGVITQGDFIALVHQLLTKQQPKQAVAPAGKEQQQQPAGVVAKEQEASGIATPEKRGASPAVPPAGASPRT